MRSLILVLALAAPVSAVAVTPNLISTPTYANAVSSASHAKQDVVFMTFVNYTVQDREVRVADKTYRIPYFSTLHVYAPIGSPVFVYSETNSKMNGQELMRVSANDADKSVYLK